MQSHVTAGSVTIGYRELQHLFAARIEQALSRFFFRSSFNKYTAFAYIIYPCLQSVYTFNLIVSEQITGVRPEGVGGGGGDSNILRISLIYYFDPQKVFPTPS